MDSATRRLISLGASIAPALHTATDVLEWWQGGFSPAQLWLNYAAFLPMPAVLLGLYAAQRPAIGQVGLAGALAFGFSFVYFAHTTLIALTMQVATYEALWADLGSTYTAHGALMVVGGLAFGGATFRAGVLPRWAVSVFLSGLVLNLVVAVLPVPAMFQTLGTTLRNAGLIGMGWAVRRSG